MVSFPETGAQGTGAGTGTGPSAVTAAPSPSQLSESPPPTSAKAPVEPGNIEDEHLNTDGRARFDWRGHYAPEAHREIWFEARIVGGILFVTLAGLLLTWRGTAFDIFAAGCARCSNSAFDRYAYFYLGGQLGGILFGIKYLYKVVARGYWNLDRRLWRFFSPFLSGGLALAIGALFDSGILGLTTKTDSGSAYFSLGFIAGYFADGALAKMQEIADTIFGSPHKRQPRTTDDKAG